MPRKPKRMCGHPGCPELTEGRYCEKHQKEESSKYNMNRPSKHLYGSGRWKKLRKEFLLRHPICESCKARGIVKAATVVDHINAHKGSEELFWNQTNWQALCKQCHDTKTAKEDGRWGRKGTVYTY